MDPWSIMLALIAVALATYYYFEKNVFKKHGIPYASSVPIIGSIWKMMDKKTSFAKAMQDIYNTNKDAKYIGMYDSLSPMFVIRDIELIKTITVKSFEHFRNHRGIFSETSEPLFAQNLFFLKDEKWREVRNTISPIFTSSKLKTMFVLMRDCAKKYGEVLADLPANQNVLELKDTFTRYTNDVIATIAFGITVDSMKDKENKFYLNGRRVTDFNQTRLFKMFICVTFRRLAQIFNMKIFAGDQERFFTDIVKKNIEEREEKQIDRPDMIQLLLENKDRLGKQLSIMEITAQAFTFFFAGFETTASLMCFTAYEIGINKEVCRRLQDEIDQVLEECNGEVTYEALQSMKYLDAIIYEALRFYPVLVFTDRICTKRFELPPALPGLKPYILEEGSCISIPIYGIHHDERYYNQPEKFDPDRFMGDIKKDLNSGSFLSFGLGPRMCVANRFALLETKVLLFHLFAKCNFKPCDKTAIPLSLSKNGMISTPESGIWLKVESRDRTSSL